MAAPRVKTGKQPIQASSDDQSFATRLREGIEQNRHRISLAVAGLFVVALIVGGIQKYRESREIAAQQAYAPVVQQWPREPSAADNQAWDPIIAELRKFTQEHSGNRVAWMAGMDLARALLQARRYEDALAQALKCVDSAPDTLSKNMARYQAGAAAQALGRVDEAIAQWASMKGEASLVTERELNYQLAALYRAKKDIPRTLELLESALKSPGDYPTNQLIEEELSSVKSTSGKTS